MLTINYVKLPLNKNIFFIGLIVLLNLFCCSSMKTKTRFLEGNILTSMNYADLSLIQVSTKSQLRDENDIKTNSEPENTTSLNSTNTTDSSSTLSNETSADLVKDAMAENAKKIEKLEKAIQDQSQIVEDIKKVSSDVTVLSVQMNLTEERNKELSKAVEEMKGLYEALEYKLSASSLETDNKLNQINSRVITSLRNQLNLQIFNINKELIVLQDEITVLDTKINKLKARLPNPDSVCTMYNNCAGCTSNPACGWCSMSQQCVEGDEKGPKDGGCNFYDYNICSGPKSCDSYSTCSDCVRDVSCGWCNTPGLPLCISKDQADSGKCKEDIFVHLWKALNVCPHETLVFFFNLGQH
jgi:hypothetical protein